MNLDNYVDVATRLTLALERWPELRVQETDRELIELGEQLTLICTVTVWRTPDDQLPSIASAAEPIPAVRPSFRGSELMIGMTSALGRALGYMGIGINGSIASANEVEARQSTPEGSQTDAPARRAPLGSAASEGPSKAQLGLLRSLNYTGPTPKDKREASAIIDGIKKAQIAIDSANQTQEDPF